MRIEKVTGCLADVFTIDGVDWENHTDEQKANILNNILDRVISEAHQDIDRSVHDILYLLEPDTVEMDEEPCDQCYDYITEETWIIEE